LDFRLQLIVKMAELATPSAAQVATADATAPQEKQQNARPEKPDEDKYKEDLAKAEKEHSAAQDKLVGSHNFDVRLVARTCLSRACAMCRRLPAASANNAYCFTIADIILERR
jgi:recombinational DNA repair ATPase RecF